MLFLDRGTVSRIRNDDGLAQMLGGFTGIVADVSFHLAQPVTEEFQLHVVHVVILGHLEDGVFGQNGLVRGCHRSSLYFQARHCFSPAMKVSFGRLRPMNTILLDGVSWGSHFLPTSAPIIMWTPWNTMRRGVPLM